MPPLHLQFQIGPWQFLLGPWDAALVALVAVQATLIAYVYQPRWKALLFSLPIPFTLSALAVGRPVGAANALGLLLLLAFMHAVRALHYNLRVGIVPAIALAALSYCAVGAAAMPHVPPGGAAYWVATACTVAAALIAWRLTPRKAEPGHRTALPVAVKLPLILAVLVGMVAIKGLLQGFLTTFPFVGIITAYEARTSLWTICRQTGVIMLALSLLMICCRLGQDAIGLGPSLAIGWAAFLGFLLPLSWPRGSQPQ